MNQFASTGLILLSLLYFFSFDTNQTVMPKKVKVGLEDALSKLDDSGTAYQEYFQHGSMRIGLYGPHEVDGQNPHDQDELYVIAKGSGRFMADGQEFDFTEGDVLFVAAHAEHRFIEFSEDFKTWVFFYGPKGGESGDR